ncbi:hypothetical protein CFOL_v3_21340 [Cephalotus follicularis]|uniref:Knottin scorpion toxin-like domain-containing protein n=1 Tax=Cephalotus follicularis TaxID=3775 RepID=A0A1Q3CCN0_CEPFO|nr:hypothetical protein CFOL_v3_21340 [Cephalotus follicularis]
MATMRVFTFVLLLVLMLCIGLSLSILLAQFCSEEVVGQDSICCREHPEFGKCVPGNESEENCNSYCSKQCRGGFCKRFANNHHKCHCYC